MEKKLKEKIKISNPINFFSLCKSVKGFVSNDDILNDTINANVNYIGNIKKARYFYSNYKRDTIVNWLKMVTWELTDTIDQYYDNHKNNPNNKIILPDSNNITD
jgi:hypothetical protein